MDQMSKKTPNPKYVGFSQKLTSKGTWRQVFIYLRLSLPSSSLLVIFVWGGVAIL
jgi:hypothetical protein